VDYISTPITATFIAGTTSTMIDVPVASDNISEGLETFNLRLTNISSSLSGVEPGEDFTTAIVQIVDTTGHNNGLIKTCSQFIAISTGLLVNFTSNNFTGSEAFRLVTAEIALSYYELKDIMIEMEIVLSEFSPRSATGTYSIVEH